jgi:hypothetical protein
MQYQPHKYHRVVAAVDDDRWIDAVTVITEVTEYQRRREHGQSERWCAVYHMDDDKQDRGYGIRTTDT